MDLQKFMQNFIWDYKEDEIVKCECYSKNCIQRKIQIFDIVKGYPTELKVCNSIVKLMFENVDYTTYLYSNFVEYVIYDYYKGRYGIKLLSLIEKDIRSFSNILITVVLSEKPCIGFKVPIIEIFSLMIQNKTMSNNKWILQKILVELEKYFDSNNFKKNKSLKLKVLGEIKKLRNVKDKDLDSTVIEIVNNVFQLIIKNQPL